jgi:predicted nuclease of predicted toxin-antitoxin system
MAQWMEAVGHEAEHLEAVGLLDAEDGAVWAHAVCVGAIIVTKDEDFSDRSIRVSGGPVIVWLRVGNASNRALRDWLNPRLPELINALKDGSHRLIDVC